MQLTSAPRRRLVDDAFNIVGISTCGFTPRRISFNVQSRRAVSFVFYGAKPYVDAAAIAAMISQYFFGFASSAATAPVVATEGLGLGVELELDSDAEEDSDVVTTNSLNPRIGIGRTGEQFIGDAAPRLRGGGEFGGDEDESSPTR